MRSGALAIAVVAALGCKDNTPKPQPQPAATGRTAQPTQQAGERPALPQPEGVTGPGLVEVSRLSATVALGHSDLQVDGVSLGYIRDGRVPRDKLDQLTRQLEGKVNSDDPVGIALDPTLPYLRVSELLASMRTAGFRNLALLTGGGKMIPLELPDEAQLNTGNVRMVVTVRGGAVLLWSITGQEGTKDKPKVAVGAGASLDKLTKALVEIVERRWPDGRRPDADRTILVQVAPQETAGRLLQVLALLRTEGRLELFPNVFLAAGA